MFDRLKGMFGRQEPSGPSAGGSAIAVLREARFETRSGAIAKSIDLYREALKLDPDLADAHAELADLLNMQGKSDEALAHYQRAVELEPTKQEAHYKMGRILLERKRVDLATAAFLKELEVTPRFGRVHNDLAVAYFHQKNFAKAIEHCDQAQALGEPVHDGFLKALEPHRKRK